MAHFHVAIVLHRLPILESVWNESSVLIPFVRLFLYGTTTQ